MESKKLEALLMAVDLGSFTKAAEVLGYTQSGLTHMMNSLEKEVGFTLLERGRSGVRLTEEGERIAPAVREFLQANARLDSVIEQVASSRTEIIRVSAYASIAMHWLPGIIQRFREECPDVDVDIRMADHVDVPYELLAQGKMDAILVSPQDEGQYEWVHLADDPMFAVLPKDFDTQGMTAFPLAAFEARDFIMPSQGFDKDIMRIFNRIGVKPHILPTWVDDHGQPRPRREHDDRADRPRPHGRREAPAGRAGVLARAWPCRPLARRRERRPASLHRLHEARRRGNAALSRCKSHL